MEFKQVSIPVDYFFHMAIKDYTNWKLALVREFIQNAVDAGAKNITFNQKQEGYLKVTDDGSGMSRSIIENSLLTLGGSEKFNEDAVGGLGKAKEILYFSWPWWEIHTKDLAVTGKGGYYNITDEGNTYVDGTTSTVKTNGKFPDVLRKLQAFCNYCNLPGVSINYETEGEEQSFNSDGVKQGKRLHEIEGLGDLYEKEGSSSTYSGEVIVQAHGLYMFSTHTVLDKSYVFNITRKSYDCLTANRDGFIGDWQDKFNKMVSILSVESESLNASKEYLLEIQPLTFEEVEVAYETIKENFGENLELYFGKPIVEITNDEVDQFVAGSSVISEKYINKSDDSTIKKFVHFKRNTKRMEKLISIYREGFQEGFRVVSDVELSNRNIRSIAQQKSFKLLCLWREVVKEVAKCIGRSTNGFGFGIVNVAEVEARIHGDFFMINPAAFDKYNGWKTISRRLLLTACHEWTHYLGVRYHNETFIAKSEEIMFQVLQDRLNTRDIRLKVKALNGSKKDDSSDDFSEE